MTWRHDTTISCAVSVAVESSISSAEMDAFLSRYKECTYEYVGIDDVGLEFTYEDVGIDNVGLDARPTLEAWKTFAAALIHIRGC